jgi:hypothetical protein
MGKCVNVKNLGLQQKNAVMNFKSMNDEYKKYNKAMFGGFNKD